MDRIINKLGYDVPESESPTDSMARQAVFQFACILGHSRSIQEFYDRFVEMRSTGAWYVLFAKYCMIN